MLHDLKILNGEMSLNFDFRQTKYSVLVDADARFLDFVYKVDDGVKVQILNNDLANSDEVTLIVSNGDVATNYVFSVLKDEMVFDTYNSFNDVSIKKEVSSYVVPSVASICFLLILFLFVLLFHKRKSR